MAVEHVDKAAFKNGIMNFVTDVTEGVGADRASRLAAVSEWIRGNAETDEFAPMVKAVKSTLKGPYKFFGDGEKKTADAANEIADAYLTIFDAPSEEERAKLIDAHLKQFGAKGPTSCIKESVEARLEDVLKKAAEATGAAINFSNLLETAPTLEADNKNFKKLLNDFKAAIPEMSDNPDASAIMLQLYADKKLDVCLNDVESPNKSLAEAQEKINKLKTEPKIELKTEPKVEPKPDDGKPKPEDNKPKDEKPTDKGKPEVDKGKNKDELNIDDIKDTLEVDKNKNQNKNKATGGAGDDKTGISWEWVGRMLAVFSLAGNVAMFPINKWAEHKAKDLAKLPKDKSKPDEVTPPQVGLTAQPVGTPPVSLTTPGPDATPSLSVPDAPGPPPTIPAPSLSIPGPHVPPGSPPSISGSNPPPGPPPSISGPNVPPGSSDPKVAPTQPQTPQGQGYHGMEKRTVEVRQTSNDVPNKHGQISGPAMMNQFNEVKGNAPTLKDKVPPPKLQTSEAELDEQLRKITSPKPPSPSSP